MNLSSRRARRTEFRRASARRTGLGKRVALTVPVAALVAVSTFIAPSYADDAGTGDAPASSETQAPAADPAPEPKPAPEPAPAPKPAPEPKSADEPEPAPAQPADEPETEQAPAPEEEAAPAPVQEIPADAVPAGDGAEVGAAQIKAGAAQAAAPASNKKVVVCKYVGTPPGKPHHIIVVSKSAIKDWPEGTFPWTFADAQDSVAIRWAVGNEQPGNEELVNCPGFDPGEPAEPVVITPPDVQAVDPCGPANAEYPAIAETEQYSVTVNADKSVTLTAKDGFTFADDAPSHTYPAPVDSGTECPQDEKKVVVCKYVGTPPGVPHHIIVVSKSAALAAGWVEGQFPGVFADAQDSIAIRWAVGNEQPGDEELVNCPLADIEPPVIEPVDPCGPDNVAFPAVEDTDEYTAAVVDGDVVLTANPGYEFPGGEHTFTYELPADSGEACPPAVIEPPVLEPTDPCGPDNAVYPALAETDQFGVTVNGDRSVTLTAKAGYVFANQQASYTYPTPADSNEPCPEVAALVACVYPDAPARLGTGVPAGVITVIDEATALLNGFLGSFPFSYVNGDGEVELIAYLEDGQTVDDFDALEMCGEVAGICDDATDPGAVDENGEPCVPGEPGEPGDGGETGGETDALPNTGGPAGFLLPIGALMVLVGAGLVVVRRPHSA